MIEQIYCNQKISTIIIRVKIDFYDDNRKWFETKIAATGDVILIASGGHGFEMLEPTEMIEVKEGPFVGEADKIRFE